MYILVGMHAHMMPTLISTADQIDTVKNSYVMLAVLANSTREARRMIETTVTKVPTTTTMRQLATFVSSSCCTTWT